MKECWCIPSTANAAFVAAMEDVLEVYTRPYDPRFPQVCMDEASKQLLADVQVPLPPRPATPEHHGTPTREDYEYERAGTANLFLACEPLRGWRHVAVTARRTAVDWAHFIRDVVDGQYPDAERIVLVLDNLNTHRPASLYDAFAPAEARRLLQRLEIHYTPKHGSWLDMAEIELSALARQCLDRRIATREQVAHEVAAWEEERNAAAVTIDWRFTTADARIKLKHLYPTLVHLAPETKDQPGATVYIACCQTTSFSRHNSWADGRTRCGRRLRQRIRDSRRLPLPPECAPHAEPTIGTAPHPTGASTAAIRPMM